MELRARTQIFKPYALLIVCITLVLMFFLYIIVGGSNYSTALYRQQEVLTGDAEKLASQLNQVALIASQVNSGNELLNMFIQLDSDNNPDNYFEENLLDSIRAGSILETINSLTDSLARICVFNTHGDMVSAGRLYVDNVVAESMLSGDLPAFFAQQLTSQSNLLIGPHADWWSGSDEQIFSYIIPLSSMYNEKSYGFIAVEFSAEQIQTMDFLTRDDGCFYALTARDGSDALASGLSEQQTLEILTAISASKAEVPHTRMKIGGVRYEFVGIEVADTGRTLLRAVPIMYLLKPYIIGYVCILLGFIALIAILLVVAYRMADRVTRPLNEYARALSGITLNNMTIPDTSMVAGRNLELEMLDQSFRRLLKKLNSSMELEIKAYLNALQSQMDPHFLYNMMTVIAEIADTPDDPDANAQIVRICQRLSQMLRYMSSYDNHPVTLRDEITQLSNYLELMHIRYGDYFTYELSTQEDMLDILVPKMILQPLAENCFQHGFKQVRPPWHVSVDMHRDMRYWRVTVRDNGVGITDEEISDVQRKVHDFSVDVAGSYQNLRIGGMGLVNTVLRMRLSQVEEPLFEIMRCGERGTQVTLGGKVL